MENNRKSFRVPLTIAIVALLVIGGGVYAHSRNTATKTVNFTPDQIFQEASSQLGLSRSQLAYFRIFGQDKIQYSLGSGTNFAYKVNGKWYLAGKGNYQAVPECSDFVSVPSQYNPGCYDQTAGKNEYMRTNQDGTGEGVNYPSSQMISYIGNF